MRVRGAEGFATKLDGERSLQPVQQGAIKGEARLKAYTSLAACFSLSDAGPYRGLDAKFPTPCPVNQ